MIGDTMDVGIYAPELDSDEIGAPEYCIKQTIPHLRDRISITLLTHEHKRHPIYKDQRVISNNYLNINSDINKADLDVVHFCGFAHRDVPILLSPPTVLSYHGDVQWAEPHLNYGDNPLRASRRQRMIEVIKLCQYDHVAYVSDDVRSRVEQRYSRFSPPSTVVYNGIDHNHYRPVAPEPMLNKYDIERPYVLHVSNFSERKNPGRLVRAFREATKYCGVDLVIVGDGWEESTEINNLLDRMNVKDKVSMLGYVSERDLPGLYSGAEVFVFPSIHECFGLPVIEAMACSTPVITANSYALPEIADSAAVYCDNTSIESIANTIEYVVKCDDVQERYSRFGRERASKFSWERRAEELVEVYRSVTNRKGQTSLS